MQDAPPDVFVYAGQLICDSARGRRRRLKSLVVPEIIVMSLQLVSAEEQSSGGPLHAPAGAVMETFALPLLVFTVVFPWSG